MARKPIEQEIGELQRKFRVLERRLLSLPTIAHSIEHPLVSMVSWGDRMLRRTTSGPAAKTRKAIRFDVGVMSLIRALCLPCVVAPNRSPKLGK